MTDETQNAVERKAMDAFNYDGPTEVTVDFAEFDLSRDDFHSHALPFTLGVASSAGYGITGVGWESKTITAEKVEKGN